MPAPPQISTQLEGVTDPLERGRIKAQGLVAHLEWAAKKLPYTWTTPSGYTVTVYSVVFADPAFEVMVGAWKPPVTVPDEGGGTKEVREPLTVDNPIRIFNPPYLMGGSLVEDALAVAKQIIEDACGVPR